MSVKSGKCQYDTCYVFVCNLANSGRNSIIQRVYKMAYTQLSFKKEKFVKISIRLSVIDGYNRQSISERTVYIKMAIIQQKQ